MKPNSYPRTCKKCGLLLTERRIYYRHRLSCGRFFTCEKCQKTFMGVKSFKKHLDNCTNAWKCTPCPESNCNYKFTKISTLVKHLEFDHCIENCTSVLEFENYGSFKKWKEGDGFNMFSLFRKTSGSKMNALNSYSYYSCLEKCNNRDSNCLARIYVRMKCKVRVAFIGKHNHELPESPRQSRHLKPNIRHINGMKIPNKNITCMSDTTWRLQSRKNKDLIFLIEKINEECPLLNECMTKTNCSCYNLCKHLYECNCSDKSICVHAHKVHSVIYGARREEDDIGINSDLDIDDPRIPTGSDVNNEKHKIINMCLEVISYLDSIPMDVLNHVSQIVEHTVNICQTSKIFPFEIPRSKHVDEREPCGEIEESNQSKVSALNRLSNVKRKVITIYNNSIGVTESFTKDIDIQNLPLDEIKETLFYVDDFSISPLYLKSLDINISEYEDILLQSVDEKFQKGRLYDHVIDAYISSISKLNTSFHYFGSCTSQLLSTKCFIDYQSFDSSWSDIIMPCNTRSHWHLIYFDGKNKNIIIFDPVKPKTPCQGTKIVIRNALKLLSNMSKIQNIDDWYVKNICYAGNNDQSSSGVYVCWYAECLIKKLNVNDDNFDSNAYRYDIFKCLMRNRRFENC